MKRYTWYGVFIKSIAVGTANIVPGLSGGTIAYITGIYVPTVEAFHCIISRSSDALSTNRVHKKSALLYLLFVAAGVIVGVLGTGPLFAHFFFRYYAMFSLFLAGLISGNIPDLLRSAHRLSAYSPRRSLILLLPSSVLLCYLGVLALNASAVHLTISADYMRIAYIFLLSVCAGLVMAIPGLSGSLVLLMSGVYELFLQAMRQIDILPLAAVVLGGVLGLILFVRIFYALFQRHMATIRYLVCAAVIGSAGALIWQHMAAYQAKIGISAGIFIAAALLGYLVSHLGREVSK